MIVSGLLGASTNFFMFAFGKTENYLFMGILLLIGNTLFGYSIVMYNAYLPFLCKDHPEVRALIAAKEKAHKVVDKFKDIQDEVSNESLHPATKSLPTSLTVSLSPERYDPSAVPRAGGCLADPRSRE